VPDNGEFTVYMSYFITYALFLCLQNMPKINKKSVPNFLLVLLLYVSSSTGDNWNQQPFPIFEIHKMGPSLIFVLVYLTVPKLNKEQEKTCHMLKTPVPNCKIMV
jgi:hypothetical protein